MARCFLILGRMALLALVLAATAGSSLASEKEKKEKGIESISFQSLGIPIIENGRLTRYTFIRFKLVLSGDNAKHLLDANRFAPFVRDAIVRESYLTSLGLPGGQGKLDQVKFKALVRRSWAKFSRDVKILDIVITEEKIGAATS